VTVHDRLRPGHTVVEELAAAGHDTGVFTANEFVAGPSWGVAGAFGTVVGAPDAFDDRYDRRRRTGRVLLRGGAPVVDRRRRRAVDGLSDPHRRPRPYRARGAHDRWRDDRAREVRDALDTRWEWTFHGGDRPYWQFGALETPYDGGIGQADAVVARVVDRLRDRGTLDDTLLVVTGDHGGGLGEPGRLPGEPRNVAHVVPTGEQLFHVPLLVRPPDGGEVRRVDGVNRAPGG
jgi:hypothetical protein